MMRRWEYMIGKVVPTAEQFAEFNEPGGRALSMAHREEFLNTLGDQGWEIVSGEGGYDAATGEYFALLKREKQ